MFLPLLLLAVQTDAAPATASDAKPEKKVCRRMEAPTGSIMPARSVCHTKTEWAAIDAGHANDSDALNAARQRDAARTGH